MLVFSYKAIGIPNFIAGLIKLSVFISTDPNFNNVKPLLK